MDNTNNYHLQHKTLTEHMEKGWDSCQLRNIDPHSPVTSENHNMLLKAVCSGPEGYKLYVKGFSLIDLGLYVDPYDNETYIVAEIGDGLCVIECMVIEFVKNGNYSGDGHSLIKVCNIEDETKDYYIVVYFAPDYKNATVQYAEIQAIPCDEYERRLDKQHYLKIGKLKRTMWGQYPSDIELHTKWLAYSGGEISDDLKDKYAEEYEQAKKEDPKNSSSNIPSWMGDAFVKVDGSGKPAYGLTCEWPQEDPWVANKEYVDHQINHHDSVHDHRFIRKWDDLSPNMNKGTEYPEESTAELIENKTRDDIDIYKENPKFGLHKSTMDDLGLDIYVSGERIVNLPPVELPDDGSDNPCGCTCTCDRPECINCPCRKPDPEPEDPDNPPEIIYKDTGVNISTNTDKIIFSIYDSVNYPEDRSKTVVVSEMSAFGENHYGVTGAVFNADIAEYFETDMTTMPKHGECVIIRNGKALLSDSEGDPSCIGCVSYYPAYILGGSVDFKKEFEENHKIPVAILGQIKHVTVYSSEYIKFGASIISGNNGMFKAVGHKSSEVTPSNYIGKCLSPVYSGVNDNTYILIK